MASTVAPNTQTSLGNFFDFLSNTSWSNLIQDALPKSLGGTGSFNPFHTGPNGSVDGNITNDQLAQINRATAPPGVLSTEDFNARQTELQAAANVTGGYGSGVEQVMALINGDFSGSGNFSTKNPQPGDPPDYTKVIFIVFAGIAILVLISIIAD
jgi:hypothetical protein